jgi:hypothetical protein
LLGGLDSRVSPNARAGTRKTWAGGSTTMGAGGLASVPRDAGCKSPPPSDDSIVIAPGSRTAASAGGVAAGEGAV